MLVYANCLPFDNNCSVEEMFEVIANWLKKKTRQHFTGEMLKIGRSFPVNVGDLQTWVDGDDKLSLFALRYAHPDSRTSGRQWVTEIGFRHELTSGESLCTIVVQTSEISTRVIDSVLVSRPVFVPQIATLCSASNRVVGTEVITLDDATVEALPYHIDDDNRKHPIVLISPTNSGDYMVQAEQLISHLVGLAEVIRIPNDMDTRWMARVLGEQYAAYRGAINIIFPQRYMRDGRRAFTKKLLPEDLEDMLADGVNLESELLSIVTHHSNLPNSWRHVSPEKVREASRSREIVKRRDEAKATGEQSDYVSLLEEDNGSQQEKINVLEASLRAFQTQNKELNDDLEEIVWEKDAEIAKIKFSYTSDTESLKSALAASGRRTDGGVVIATQETVTSFVSVLSQSPTLEDSLTVIETLFPDRVYVLEDARKSTKDAKKFRHQQKAFDLLLKLATTFWQGKAEGKTDKDAGSFFGDDFSPWESDGIMDNKRGREERTFIYDGTLVQMTNHLKIGTKISDAETLTVYPKSRDIPTMEA